MSHYGGRIAQLSSVRLGGRRSRPRRGRALQLGILGFLLGLGAMGAAWWYSIGPRQTLSLYWLTSADNSIDYVQQERRVRAFDTQEAIRLALEELIAGPRDPHLTTAIPPRRGCWMCGWRATIFSSTSPPNSRKGGDPRR
jgi:hypothetical protein